MVLKGQVEKVSIKGASESGDGADILIGCLDCYVSVWKSN